jgi:inorganic triphosphatase YgiF
VSEDEITSMTETERKYDVDEDAPAPELTGFETRPQESIDLLEATYFDTEDGALAARRMVLRRRSGGHDAGWHLKTPGVDGRTEHHAPLSDAPPAGLLTIVGDILAGRELTEVARIITERSPILVLDEDGAEVAEIADDRVSTTDLRTGILRTWREWEVELLGGAPTAPEARAELLDRLEAELLEQGATPAVAVSKFARATGRMSLGADPA